MHVNSLSRPPAIGLTLGEPSGIGPDIAAMLSSNNNTHKLTNGLTPALVFLTDPHLLETRATQLGINLKIVEVTTDQLKTLAPTNPGEAYILKIPLQIEIVPGKPSTQSAPWVLDTIATGVRLCLDQHLSALITGPVQKSIVNDAGILFSGHTEFIADLINRQANHQKGAKFEPLMVLTSGQTLEHPLRVALATTHHPLAKVPALITEALITEKLNTLNKDLQHFYGIATPRILVSGLNPHAGEQGHLGHEDDNVILPVIQAAQNNGIDAIGPLPADTLFTPRYLKTADAVLAMYHDQGLPVLKYASFGGGINVTLGLPILRTSVDHGTALDLAGTGQADPSSLQAAINEACLILEKRGAGKGR